MYTARLKVRGGCAFHVRQAGAFVYRESFSGRIAALVYNNASLFPSRYFAVVLCDAFRTEGALQTLEKSLITFENRRICAARTTRATTARSDSVNNSRSKVEHLLNRVLILTYYQSEDPIWFLLRIFRFTSRTAHVFKAAVARDYEALLGGLAWKLRGRVLSHGAQPLFQDHILVREHLRSKWDQVIMTLGMTLARQARPSSRTAVAERLVKSSASRISATTKAELLNCLSVFGRAIDTRVNKPEVVAAVMQLRADISSGPFPQRGARIQIYVVPRNGRSRQPAGSAMHLGKPH